MSFLQYYTLVDICLLQKWHEEITVYKDEVEEVGLLAQQILEDTHTSSRMGRQATHLASRYHTLILHVLVSSEIFEGIAMQC